VASVSRERKAPHPGSIDWEALSDDAARMMVEIAIPQFQGYSHEQIAKQLGCSPTSVGLQLARLRREILEKSDPL